MTPQALEKFMYNPKALWCPRCTRRTLRPESDADYCDACLEVVAVAPPVVPARTVDHHTGIPEMPLGGDL